MAASGPLAHEATDYSNGNYSVRKTQFSFKENKSYKFKNMVPIAIFRSIFVLSFKVFKIRTMWPYEEQNRHYNHANF